MARVGKKRTVENGASSLKKAKLNEPAAEDNETVEDNHSETEENGTNDVPKDASKAKDAKNAKKAKTKSKNEESTESNNDGDKDNEEEGEEKVENEEDPQKRNASTRKRVVAAKPQKVEKAASKVSNKKKATNKAKGAVKKPKESDNEEYEVAKILDVRTRRGTKEFLVHWKGWSTSNDSWEPEINLSCDDLIKTFLNSKSAGDDGGKKLREDRKQPEKFQTPQRLKAGLRAKSSRRNYYEQD